MKTIWILTQDSPHEAALKRVLRRAGFDVRLFDRSFDMAGTARDGDIVMVLGWAPAALEFAYTRDLMAADGKKLSVVGYMMETGSYDPMNMAAKGFEIPTKDWLAMRERAILGALDACLVATNHHRQMVKSAFDDFDTDGIKVVGGLLEKSELVVYRKPRSAKAKQVFFPYPVAEGQSNPTDGYAEFERVQGLFNAAHEEQAAEVKWVAMTPDMEREDYLETMSRSQVAFCARMAEVWPIEMLEAAEVGTFPMAPARLCYPEVLGQSYCYPEDDEKIVEMLRSRLFDKLELNGVWQSPQDNLRRALEEL